MWDDESRTQPKPIEKRKHRLDTVARGAVAARAESRSLLGLFRLWEPQPKSERRRAPRHTVVESQVWLVWADAQGNEAVRCALIINLSRGGALIFVDEAPPKDRLVWISLGKPGPIGRVEARVVAIKSSRQGQCAVRIEFCDPCPYGFFEAAVCGLAPSDPRGRSRRGTGFESRPVQPS